MLEDASAERKDTAGHQGGIHWKTRSFWPSLLASGLTTASDGLHDREWRPGDTLGACSPSTDRMGGAGEIRP